MKSMQLVTVLLDLISKNAEDPSDRIDVPLALHIVACKVNDISKETALKAIEDSWDDIRLISSEEGTSEDIKH